MPEQISNKNLSPDFLESEKYRSLQKEVTDSMASTELAEDQKEDREIAPAFDYFEKELIKNGISEIQAEKLFWETVVEKIKKIRFRSIYRMIFPDIERGDYSSARRVLVEELKETVKKFSSILYHNLSRRSVALMVLKEKFYSFFPEIEALIEETEEEKRTKVKIPSGRFSVGGEQEEKVPSSSGGEFQEELGNPYLVKERNWEVPEPRELISGLIITLIDRQTYDSQTMEFLSDPGKGKNGDFFVKVKWNNVIGLINLADFDLLAYGQSSLWNSRYFPKSWKMK